MVDRSYMAEKPVAPSGPVRVFNQRVMPAAIDVAGLVEAGVERLAVGTRKHKMLALVGAFGVGWALARVR